MDFPLRYNVLVIFLRKEGDCVKYQRIRDLREDKDLTQKQMGEILSCSQRVYSNYERGELDIPTEILIKLADFHEVSVDYILNRTSVKKMSGGETD